MIKKTMLNTIEIAMRIVENLWITISLFDRCFGLAEFVLSAF